MPKAPELLSKLYAHYIAAGHLSVSDVAGAVLAVPPLEEDAQAPLVDADMGLGFVYELMGALKEGKGEDDARAAWAASGLKLADFVCR